MFVQLDRNAARSWQAAQVPRWVPRIVLVGAAVAAFIANLELDDTPCSATDPTVCGPDLRFTVALALLLATPILLWWLPLLGCVAGAGFAAADLAFDPLVEGKLVWGVFGALCVLVGLWLVWSGRRQRRVIARLGQSRTRVSPPHLLAKAQETYRHSWLGWVPVAVGLAAGAAAFVAYGNEVASEQAHLDVARRIDARVIEYDTEDYLVTVDTGSSGRRVIDALDTYDAGARVPVLIDPSDSSWARLVAEPADFTFPETLGLDCLLLAGCLAWRQIAVRRTDRRLLSEDVPALEVLVRPVDYHTLTVYSADDSTGERPIATFSTGGSADDVDERHGRDDSDSFDDPDDTDPAEYGRQRRHATADLDSEDLDDEVDEYEGCLASRLTEPTPATLFGSFHDRARVAFVADRPGVVIGRLRAVDAVSRLFGVDRAVADPPAEEPVAVEAPRSPVAVVPSTVDTDTELTTNLPRTVRHSLLDRLVFGIYAAAGLAAVPAIELLVDSARWYNRVFVAILGLEFVAYCAARATTRLVLDREALTVTGMFFVRVIPWHRVNSASVDRNRLAIAYEPATTIKRGPYTGRKGGGPSAESVAAAIMSLRASALATGTSDASVRVRPSVGRLAFLALYTLGIAASLWLAARG